MFWTAVFSSRTAERRAGTRCSSPSPSSPSTGTVPRGFIVLVLQTPREPVEELGPLLRTGHHEADERDGVGTAPRCTGIPPIFRFSPAVEGDCTATSRATRGITGVADRGAIPHRDALARNIVLQVNRSVERGLSSFFCMPRDRLDRRPATPRRNGSGRRAGRHPSTASPRMVHVVELAVSPNVPAADRGGEGRDDLFLPHGTRRFDVVIFHLNDSLRKTGCYNV